MSALGNSFSELIRSVLRNPAQARDFAIDHHTQTLGKVAGVSSDKLQDLTPSAIPTYGQTLPPQRRTHHATASARGTA